VSRSTGAPLILVTAELIEFAFEMRDAVPDSPPIRFQLRFAGSARAYSTAQPGQFLAFSGKSWKQIS
jgi:hypothetical protein